MKHSIKQLILFSRNIAEKKLGALACQFYFSVNPRDKYIVLRDNHGTFLQALIHVLYWCQQTFEGYVTINTEIDSPYVKINIKQDTLTPYFSLKNHVTSTKKIGNKEHPLQNQKILWQRPNPTSPLDDQNSSRSVLSSEQDISRPLSKKSQYMKSSQNLTVSILGDMETQKARTIPPHAPMRFQTKIKNLVSAYPLQHASQLLEIMDGMIRYTSRSVEMQIPIEQFYKITIPETTPEETKSCNAQKTEKTTLFPLH